MRDVVMTGSAWVIWLLPRVACARYDPKPYEYGDSFQLDLQRTLRNALHRGGPGVPVKLLPEDFEIERTEHLIQSSTVLMLDLSLSMRDNFLPAKKVAMALHSLISMQFPMDYLGIIGFGEVARELKADQSGDVFFNYPPARETLDATLREVMRYTRADIRINTFMLDADAGLRGFIEQLVYLHFWPILDIMTTL